MKRFIYTFKSLYYYLSTNNSTFKGLLDYRLLLHNYSVQFINSEDKVTIGEL